MYITQQKEQFSLAYVHAIATVAGYALADIRVDDDSVDCLLCSRGRSGRVHSPRVEVQLKCTASHAPGPEHLAFPLSMKNYDDLRDPEVHVPHVLVVVCVPNDVTDWLVHSEEQLALRRCGYWMSLRDLPPQASAAKDPRVTVHLPRSQHFSVAQLQAIMSRVATGGLP